MAELIPILGGSLAGLAAARLRTRRATFALLAVVSVTLAVVAGVVSGELAQSAGFLLWDTAQALAAGALSATAAPRVARRLR